MSIDFAVVSMASSLTVEVADVIACLASDAGDI